MFSPNTTVIDSFVSHATDRFSQALPGCDKRYVDTLALATRGALETLLNCNCSYHDIDHTVLVTDVGQTILLGRLISRGDITALDWLHGVIAMLYHDIGYRRGLLNSDEENNYVADESGNRIVPPPGATDAFMTPYHVTRGCIYMHERFVDDELVNVATVASCIEMTRFPVPDDPHYQQTDTLPGLVRAADLIGQLADPLYIRKLPRLFAEFRETGAATDMGYKNAGDLRDGYPAFFYARVEPYLRDALTYLQKTADGQQWVASLYHHLHTEESRLARSASKRPPVIAKKTGKLHKL